LGQVLYQTIEVFFNIMLLLILARIIISWLPQLRYNQISEIVFNLTEPILGPFQRLIPPIGMIDISPMVAIITLSIAQQILLFVVAGAFGLDIR
jgi:YggT family protein